MKLPRHNISLIDIAWPLYTASKETDDVPPANTQVGETVYYLCKYDESLGILFLAQPLPHGTNEQTHNDFGFLIPTLLFSFVE